MSGNKLPWSICVGNPTCILALSKVIARAGTEYSAKNHGGVRQTAHGNAVHPLLSGSIRPSAGIDTHGCMTAMLRMQKYNFRTRGAPADPELT